MLLFSPIYCESKKVTVKHLCIFYKRGAEEASEDAVMYFIAHTHDIMLQI